MRTTVPQLNNMLAPLLGLHGLSHHGLPIVSERDFIVGPPMLNYEYRRGLPLSKLIGG